MLHRLAELVRRVRGSGGDRFEPTELRSALQDLRSHRKSEVYEKRTISIHTVGVETREDGRQVIKGRAHTYGQRYDAGWFVETIHPGAFSDDIGRRDQFCFWCHRSDEILGATSNGTLKLRSDDIGLDFEAIPPAGAPHTSKALLSLEGRYVTKCSFGFEGGPREEDETWEFRDGVLYRDVYRAILYEVSPVAIPAYDGTGVTVVSERSMNRALETLGCDYTEYRKRAIERMDMTLRLRERKKAHAPGS